MNLTEIDETTKRFIHKNYPQSTVNPKPTPIKDRLGVMYFNNSTSPMFESLKETASRTVPGSSIEQEEKIRA